MGLQPGTRLGAYEIMAPLGSGGMGEVYRARDSKLGRDVALKVLPEAVARDPGRLARFEREARAVALLNHPSIVVIFSIEESAGVRFLTMELVEGEPLQTHVPPGGLPLSRLLDLAIQLTEALAAAHRKGVIHRDLKPANVIVTRDHRVKVLDFGLAKVTGTGDGETGETITDRPVISVPGEVMGTYPYMAPEQIRGEPVDGRTDLFALGVVLHELATGNRPFPGRTAADVTSAILRDPPVSVRKAKAELPLMFEQIIERCLAKEPVARFQSADELKTALRDLQRTIEEAAKEAKSRASETPSIAVLPFANMSADPENEYFSDGLSEELLNVLAKIPDLKVTGRTSSFAFKGKQEDLRDIGQKLGVRTLLEGSVRKSGNRVRVTAQLIKASDGFHLWSETYDRVLDDIFAVQDDIARSVSTALHVTLLGRPTAGAKPDAEVYELILRGNYFLEKNDKASVERAVDLYRQAIERNPKDASAWAGLAKAHLYQNFFGFENHTESRHKTEEAVERAIAIDEGSWQAHHVKALMLNSIDYRWKEGFAENRRARELAPGASGPLAALAVYTGAFGDVDEALVLARRAHELDPLDPSVLVQRARVEQWANHLDAASEIYQRVVELGSGHASVHSSLGMLYMRLGMDSKAIEETLKEEQAGYREYALAIIYHALGRPSESDAAMKRMHQVDEGYAYQFACAHAMRGENDEAFSWLERSYELHDSGLILAKMSWMFVPLHADPRWRPFLEKIGMADSSPS
jgi:eukaryotic-like serine/threonine-protein kinase